MPETINKLEVTFDCKNPFDTKVFLNGEDVASAAERIELIAGGARLYLFDTPRVIENGELKKTIITLDEIKVN